MKNDTYKNLKTEELLKKQKNLKIGTISLIVVAALTLGVEIYLVFQKDDLGTWFYGLTFVPIAALWIQNNFDKTKAEIKAELKSRKS